MSTTLSPNTGNAYIAALQKTIEESIVPIRWLVIAHDDPQMIGALNSALGNESAALLQVPQDAWKFQDPEFAESIDWALQQHPITNLLLVGNSCSGDHEINASTIESESTVTQSPYRKLLAGVKSQQERNRKSADRFASKIKEMLAIPAVEDRWSNEELHVQGLFYRAESGLFLAYDVKTNEFCPLVTH